MASRQVRLGNPRIERLYQKFVDDLAQRFDDPAIDNNDLCRDTLLQIYYGGGDIPGVDDPATPLAVAATIACFDPRNITLESEYYVEVDPPRFYKVKPLLWFWIMFDRSPLGHNDHLGFLVRRMLAKRVFG